MPVPAGSVIVAGDVAVSAESVRVPPPLAGTVTVPTSPPPGVVKETTAFGVAQVAGKEIVVVVVAETVAVPQT
jgi:hypothetical protein